MGVTIQGSNIPNEKEAEVTIVTTPGGTLTKRGRLSKGIFVNVNKWISFIDIMKDELVALILSTVKPDHYRVSSEETTPGGGTYTATTDPFFTALSTSQRFYVDFDNANAAGPVTLDLNGIGPYEVVMSGNVSLVGGELNPGQIYPILWDGTNYQIVGGGGGGGSVVSVTDDGNGSVSIDNTDPANPVVNFNGVNVAGDLTGDGTSGNPLTVTVPVITPAALSKSDDTNVTMTLSGSPLTALLQTVTLSLGWTGQLSIARGGTNSGTALNNNRVMQSSGGAIVEAPAITASRVLVSDANGIPTHSSVTSTTLSYLDATSSIQTQINSLNVLTDDTEYLLVNSFRASYNY